MTETYADEGLMLEPGSIARLILNRPDRRNAMTAAMWAVIPEICDRLAQDGTRVLIVTGAGDKAFCAGADISEFETVYGTPEATAAYNGYVRTAQARLRDLACPTIADVRGVCYGGGCGLALACDFRVASADSTFAITPAKLGLAYSPSDTWQLIEKVGMPRAKDLLLTGRAVTAAEALRIGLIDRLDEDATALAEHLANLAPSALSAIKAISNGLSEPSLRPDLQAVFEATFAGPEFREGYSAFLEKRRPNFRKDPE
ncbi:enoyl-CoA hydratase/isomerase family protein [Flavimaricola marinus]|uniref:Carnitinyl-CoA dehydratase n=1 Tax=Flavimaricola marinus TaxID=1819565 RepID=A0A238LFH6_9RHOB|nr:enoyl-CoA hydratase-related protein [Flavimaricola marinus]SMY08175.1 Carnitinyl-CoA dehydratase [Flavimaricola marinus]